MSRLTLGMFPDCRSIEPQVPPGPWPCRATAVEVVCRFRRMDGDRGAIPRGESFIDTTAVRG